MFKKNTLLRALIAAGLTSGLVACGGGDSSDSGGGENPTPPSGSELTGQFVDSPVGGLEYTRSNSGTEIFLTNDNGEFNYQKDETVTFKVGQLTLGSTQGNALISPRDLASGEGATNVARVLQTLDDDGDPTNGITISAEVRSKAAKAANPRNISETTNLDDIKSEITSLASDSSVTLVSAEDANAHLEETLTSIDGSDVTSCSDKGAKQLVATDFNGLTLGLISENETLLFNFKSGGGFTEYKSSDYQGRGALAREGNWEYASATQNLSLSFPGENGEQSSDEFKICAAGNRFIAEPEGGTSYLYALNKAISGKRSAGTYLLNLSNGTGAVLTLNEQNELTYFQGDDIPTAAVTYGDGVATINWSAEHNDELYFLSGLPTRTAIYLDFDEATGYFSNIGVAASTAPIITLVPTVDDFAGNAFLFRSDEEDEVVVFELRKESNGELQYTSYFNDYHQNGVRQGAGRTEHDWSLTNGIMHLDEEDGTQERWRVALAKTTTYWALQDDEGPEEINKIDSVSLPAPLTDDSFVGTYTISIPTENNAVETLTISEGNSCDYSGTACNWSIDENGKGAITFGSGSDAEGNIWQMANRSNGYIFVITHQNNLNDVEPGFMTRK